VIPQTSWWQEGQQTLSSSYNGLSLPQTREGTAVLSAQCSPPGQHWDAAAQGPRLGYLLPPAALTTGEQP